MGTLAAEAPEGEGKEEEECAAAAVRGRCGHIIGVKATGERDGMGWDGTRC